MKPLTTKFPTQGLSKLLTLSSTNQRTSSSATTAIISSSRRSIHSSTPDPANVSPFCATGPPPEPPQPAAEHPYAKIARRRKQAELLRTAKELRNAASATNGGGGAKTKPLKKRFWQDVTIREVDGAYQIYLDTRPLRHPTTKAIVNIPLSKPLLAHALALEWDLLTSAQQATRHHLIPLTSLVCRAVDIAEDDAKHSSATAATTTTTTTTTDTTTTSSAPIRTSIATMLLRYLDTDSLLCWAPPPKDPQPEGQPTLRELQERTAGDIVSFLSTHVWPGVEIEPVLDETSIMPRRQKEGVREVIQGWVMGLDAWDLTGLERAALAGKSLLGAARLLVEWSEGEVGRPGREIAAAQGLGARRKFDVEEAAQAASIEVNWQTGRWGEVEDTHDVEKEDLRRQLGSVVLLVSGTGA